MTETERSRFAEQLDWLSTLFTWCTVTEGSQALFRGDIRGPLMSVTFDDAERTVYDVAMPILAARNIRACVYAVPAYLDRGMSYRAGSPQRIMDWSQLAEWVAAGHELGSHTQTHARLTRCTATRVDREVRHSQELLEQRLGVSVRHFAYPWGDFDAPTERTLVASGCYDTIATTRPGGMASGARLIRLRRDAANPTDTPERLEQRMRFSDRFCWIQNARRVWSNRIATSQIPSEE